MCSSSRAPPRESPSDEEQMCWICYEGHTNENPLVKDCRCMQAHRGCRARWQLQSAGKPEETVRDACTRRALGTTQCIIMCFESSEVNACQYWSPCRADEDVRSGVRQPTVHVETCHSTEDSLWQGSGRSEESRSLGTGN